MTSFTSSPSRLMTTVASIYPSKETDTYIYSLLRCLGNSRLAALTSADEVYLLDPDGLKTEGKITSATEGEGWTCVSKLDSEESRGDVLVIGARDGGVGVWDLRIGSGRKRVAKVATEQNRPVTALACAGRMMDMAYGTEMVDMQAVVGIWDLRTMRQRWQSVESHNDDITDLQFHPERSNILLSGSTDGLVSMFDTTVSDEDEALLQVVNHGSIHRAGFLADDAIYALSHDEQFSVHAVNSAAEDGVEPPPTIFGDVRKPLACEYVIDVMRSGQGPLVATGFHSSKAKVDLVPISRSPSWSLQFDRRVQLAGGHEDDIVRTVDVDDEREVVYTGGEDGNVKIWRVSA